MRRLFGTDGVRAQANTKMMRPDNILKLATAVGAYFTQHHPHKGDHRPTVVIGKDTRLSGYMVEPALTAGFISLGMDVLLLGPLPTPAVAHLTHSFRAQLGVMISASHNPARDNGIKFFGPDGLKLTDVQEKAIEDIFFSDHIELAQAQDMGRAKRLEDAQGRYLEFVKSSFPRGLRLDNLKIVVDCANGAAYKIAPRLYWELGADVIALHNNPNGMNINHECGATHVHSLQQAVLEHQADIGIALDGDADRLIVVDETGAILDGDQILAAIAMDLHRAQKLTNNIVVATQMSNLGLERYLKSHGIDLLRTGVGDRYVIQSMRENNAILGGEQSGHIILKEFAPAGDGMLASLAVLKILCQQNVPASSLRKTFVSVPQQLKNVSKSSNILENQAVQDAIKKGQDQLSGMGRLFIRPSGTEDLIRIMVEADEQDSINTVMQQILQAIDAA
ncbi:MAG: phosphoglucosamine mutase [Alphaproteobacteria bacterium]|nr:phosphoglucosamine mutase [Alphaproteobacteria bacterium]